MGLFKRLKRLMRDERGNVLVLGATVMPLLIGGAGFALDTVQISLTKRQLQRAADSAAIAGARSVLQADADAATAAAAATPAVTRDLQINDDVTIEGAPVVGMPTTGTHANNPRAVRVQLRTTQPLTFMSFFGTDESEITVEATAAAVTDGSFCMLSLEDGTDPGVTIGGNATINLGCGISTNSRAAQAITAGGSSRVTASPIMAVGGLPTASNNHFTSGTQFVPYSAEQIDPFESLPTPSPSGCRAAPPDNKKATTTITPSTPGYNATEGSFCFNGWDVDSSFNFSGFTKPTIVYINGGNFNLGSKADINAPNVVFVMTGSPVAALNMNAQAELNITAPTTGPYAGVAMYEDRRAPLNRVIKFNGGADVTINGALYFPRANFEYNGGAGMVATCLQLIARRLDFRGNGTIGNSCPANGGHDNFQATYVRLVA